MKVKELKELLDGCENADVMLCLGSGDDVGMIGISGIQVVAGIVLIVPAAELHELPPRGDIYNQLISRGFTEKEVYCRGETNLDGKNNWTAVKFFTLYPTLEYFILADKAPTKHGLKYSGAKWMVPTNIGYLRPADRRQIMIGGRLKDSREKRFAFVVLN